MSGWVGWVDVIAGQFVIGLAMGAENANVMGYQQSVTPDELQGRLNATDRAATRTARPEDCRTEPAFSRSDRPSAR